MAKGKIIQKEEKVIKVLDRLVMVKAWGYESGEQRVSCKFADKNKMYIRERKKLLVEQLKDCIQILEDGK